MDLDRKIAFKCSVNELENTSDADEEHVYGDTENVALLWEKVEKKIITCISRLYQMRVIS